MNCKINGCKDKEIGVFLNEEILNPRSIQLISKSPRRREILTKLYDEVKVIDFHFDERVPTAIDARLVPVFLAKQKMADFLESGLPKMERIITADTVVCYPETGLILGKPQNIEEAKEMLLYHFGKEHLVVTSVCYFDALNNVQTIITDETKVRFKHREAISEKVLLDYLKLLPPYGPMDKAGAYGIQEAQVSSFMIEKVVGDINTVVGFPLEKFISIIINSSSRDINS